MVEWEDGEIIYVGKDENNCYKHPYSLVHHILGKVHESKFISFNELASYIEGATAFKQEEVTIKDGIPKDICLHLNMEGPIEKLDKKRFHELLDCAGLILWKNKMV